MHARREDYSFVDVPLAAARAFIAEHHYARGSSNTAVMSVGLTRGDELAAVALWLPPTKVCAQSVAGEGWRTVLSLSRLAVRPGEPTNVASLLIGHCIRRLRRGLRWTHLVTFADESQNHRGGIYRATNWTYVGPTKPEPRWVDAEGRQVSRKATKSRTRAQMQALGYRLAGSYRKHKFTMDLTR